MKHKNQGITLIALIITIIILLILAGVTIATLTGENGILTKASTAKEKHIIEQYKEDINLSIAEEVAERKTEKKEELMIVSLDKKIREKDWLNEIYKCNSSGEEQPTFEESTHLLVESKEHYEFLIEIDEAKETAKIVSNQKGTGENLNVATITFNSNDGTNQTNSVNLTKGKETKLPQNTFTRKGYKFLEWNTSADRTGTKYENGANINIEQDITLYAIWQEPTTIKAAKEAGTVLSTTQSKTLTDDDGNSIVLPAGFKVGSESAESVAGGVVVEDNSKNEWVWIEVPKSIYSSTTTSTSYTEIETAMQTYAKDYRDSSYSDTFYSTAQHGFADATEYNNWKNSMLESVFTNGGFFIGRYEMGTDSTSVRSEGSGISATPHIKQGMMPYNYITNLQAQMLAKQLSTNGKISSLMFGIQWDLVLKFIETRKGKTQTQLKSDSSEWGNYQNISFDLNRGKYLSGSTWNKITTYTKPASSVLLSTGATTRNSTLNIYDLAGNVWEWTLEQNVSDTSDLCTPRGGGYSHDSNIYPAFGRGYNSTSNGYINIGTRPTLW